VLASARPRGAPVETPVAMPRFLLAEDGTMPSPRPRSSCPPEHGVALRDLRSASR
jgi:hypothetical protein